MCWLQLTPDIMGAGKQNQALALLVPKAWERTSCQQSRSCWVSSPWLSMLAMLCVTALLPDTGISSSVCIWALSWNLCWFSPPPEPRLFFLFCFGLCLAGMATSVIPSHPELSICPAVGSSGCSQASTYQHSVLVLSPSPASPWSSPASLWEALVEF